MCGPVVGFVGTECLEYFLDGVALPLGSYLRMVSKSRWVLIPKNVCNSPVSRRYTFGALTWRLPTFSNQGFNWWTMKTPVMRSRYRRTVDSLTAKARANSAPFQIWP